MIKKFVTALLVAAMLLVATSISWGAPGDGKLPGVGGRSTVGATWE